MPNDLAKVIKPGLLIALSSSVSGGVTYERKEIPVNDLAVVPEGDPANGPPPEDVTRWETTRYMKDPAEHAAAVKVRSKARSLISRMCAETGFGLLCPMDAVSGLDVAIDQAKKLIDDFNTTSRWTRVSIRCLRGRIASTDEEAAKAIAGEVRDLINQMSAGIEAADPETIREAADKAKEMATMLSEEKAEAIGEAVKAARRAAREIVSRVQKRGEDAKVVLADIQRGAIVAARAAFLDLDEAPDSEEPAAPTVNVQRAANLDIEDEGPAPVSATMASGEVRGAL